MTQYIDCGPSDTLQAALDTFVATVEAEYASVSNAAASLASLFSRSSAHADLRDRLLDVVVAHLCVEVHRNRGIAYSRLRDIRRRLRLLEDATDATVVERWLNAVYGINIINGRILPAGENAVQLSVYVSLAQKVGIDMLKAYLRLDVKFFFVVVYEGVVLSLVTPKDAAKSLGVAVITLDVTVVWLVEPDPQHSAELLAAGIPPEAVYSVTTGKSYGSITTSVVTRTDLFDKLGDMGFSPTDQEEILNRRSSAATVDSERLRPGDEEGDATNALSQTTPTPSEVSEDMENSVCSSSAAGSASSSNPTSSSDTSEGDATPNLPPEDQASFLADIDCSVSAVATASVLDPETVGVEPYLNALLDKIDSVQGRAILSIRRKEVLSLIVVFRRLQPIVATILEMSTTLSSVSIFTCGNKHLGRALEYITCLDGSAAILQQIQSAETDLVDTLRAASPVLAMQIDYTESLLSRMVATIRLSLQFNSVVNTLPKTTEDGGAFDDTGATQSAVEEVSSFCSLMSAILESAQRDLRRMQAFLNRLTSIAAVGNDQYIRASKAVLLETQKAG